MIECARNSEVCGETCSSCTTATSPQRLFKQAVTTLTQSIRHFHQNIKADGRYYTISFESLGIVPLTSSHLYARSSSLSLNHSKHHVQLTFPHTGTQLTWIRVVYTLIIINKAGGLVYNRDFNSALNKVSVNDLLVLAGTFHG